MIQCVYNYTVTICTQILSCNNQNMSCFICLNRSHTICMLPCFMLAGFSNWGCKQSKQVWLMRVIWLGNDDCIALTLKPIGSWQVCLHDDAQSKEYWELIGALMRIDEYIFCISCKKAIPALSQMRMFISFCSDPPGVTLQSGLLYMCVSND